MARDEGMAYWRDHHLMLPRFYRWRSRFRYEQDNDMTNGFLRSPLPAAVSIAGNGICSCEGWCRNKSEQTSHF